MHRRRTRRRRPVRGDRLTASPIARSGADALRSLGGAAAFLAVAAAIWIFAGFGYFQLLLVPISLAGAVFCVRNALVESGRAACPACGSTLRDLSCRPGATMCRGCHQFLEIREGRLHAAASDEVAPKPKFAAPLPSSARFPPLCCLCGGPASRSERARGQARVQGPSRSWMTIAVEYEVPHCDDCGGGVRIGFSPSATIVFASQPYLRAFCELNGLQPAGVVTRNGLTSASTVSARRQK